ncbi:metallophosphoesterase [Streptomyces sp. GC420]|uniref:metallophosphoesterase n=1 Tax=Streptomyces sp. GC420 TaxID=2697568 RepID=UPI0014152CA1|nr:metallophosphoesterase [Streptomyces sp. GC420]NBM18324.1 metallophosphoesterase [Streptomyces sp. GC420]
MVLVILFAVLAVLALFGGVHWYLWRRLVRDTTAKGGAARRAGTAAAFVLPLLTLGSLVAGRAGAPFAVEQALAWPGYLWLAALLYLTMALLAGEAVRPLLRRVLERRAAPAGPPWAGTGTPARTRTSLGDPAEPGCDALVRGAAAPAGDTTGPDVFAASDDGDRPAEDGPEAGTAGARRAVAVAEEPRTAGASGREPAGDAGPDGAVEQAGTVTGSVPEPATKPARDPARATETADPDGTAVTEPGPSRRLFVARTVAAAASAVAAGTVGHGTYAVMRGPGVKRVTVPLAKLPRAGHGFRIAVVSDIHLGPVLGRAHARRIVDRINATRPDLIAVVGDLVDGSVADLGPAAEPLADLEARHGAYFVTGNHEYFSGAAEWVDHVRELGLRPLENARAELPHFDLAGVNDVAGESEGDGPDFTRALGDRDRSRASVLLAHQPVVVHDAVEHGVDLQLSGHTHGGQLWPGKYLAALANPTVSGLERYGDTQLYVTRGAGAWGPPVRVGAPSDITVVELASKQA